MGREQGVASMRVGIVGGGIGGLAAAYELRKLGHEVELFEAAPRLGGQVITFPVAGTQLESFYHHIFTSDTDVIEYINELGLGDRLRWIHSAVGYYTRNRVYPFVTARDLLNFDALGLIDRIRLGLVSLYLQRKSDYSSYERVTAEKWLRTSIGDAAYETVWEPLLRGKFGSEASEIAMVWLWGKLRLRFGSREKGVGRERLGYLLGSFGQIMERLAERVRQSGSEVHTGVAVKRIEARGGQVTGIEVDHPGEGTRFHACDAVVATVPSNVFLRMAPELPESYTERLTGKRYQAVMCLILVMDRQLTPVYWLNIGDRSIPFVATIEQTNLIGPEHYQGKHIIYLSNYLDRNLPIYAKDADGVLEEYLPHLRKLNPDFRREWIQEYYLFKNDAGQPIITTNYAGRIPDLRTPVRGLYLANTTQIYPEDRGQNYSIRLARRAVKMIGEDFQPEQAGNKVAQVRS
jgi:protoporphyrinogen oxidase